MNRNRQTTAIFILLLTATITPANQADNRIDIGQFSEGNLKGWEEESFVGHTQYQIINSQHSKVLQATSQGTASGLFKEVTIDLTKTPYLNWSWRIDNIFKGNNEQSKDGDDYPARIYVVVSGGLFFWKTRALNYVWSSNQTVNTHWPNAFTGNAHMLAIRTGNNTGQWFTEKHNVRKDLKNYFDEDVTEIHAIAIMTDSDNTQQNATAYYGDIYFSDK